MKRMPLTKVAPSRKKAGLGGGRAQTQRNGGEPSSWPRESHSSLNSKLALNIKAQKCAVRRGGGRCVLLKYMGSL